MKFIGLFWVYNKNSVFDKNKGVFDLDNLVAVLDINIDDPIPILHVKFT